jgi:hypothetical protein
MRTNLCEKTNLVPSFFTVYYFFIVTFDFVSSFWQNWDTVSPGGGTSKDHYINAMVR